MATCNKNYYFVHLDENFHPIPGTMVSKRQANSNTCGTRIAQLTGATMAAPAGEVQCFPSNGLRYWYQVKSIPTGAGSSRTEIVPNSMVAIKGVPKEGTKIAGPGRSCSYIEYKIFKPTT